MNTDTGDVIHTAIPGPVPNYGEVGVYPTAIVNTSFYVLRLSGAGPAVLYSASSEP